ncbi:MAG TPA: hypothetical protein VE669_01650 [Actinomycetota bacterium]|nr:hypothetical protein [Actinomycetota bacterium]
MNRGIIVAALTAGLLASGTGPAAAETAGRFDCSSFARVQTYRGWGPALHYGRTVTVSFTAAECRGGFVTGGFTYALTGTATVYAGAEMGGDPLEVRDFVSDGSFADPRGTGWPPDWWSCDVDEATINWRIPGVYSFVAGASHGSWNLDVTVPGSDTVHWHYSAC